jgi:copper chaperone
MKHDIIKVSGMSCQHCVDAVTRAVRAQNGVSGVVVDLERGMVAVDFDEKIITQASIKAAIEDQGYDIEE